MDDAFMQLIHTGTIVYGVSIIMVTFFIRKLVETGWPSIKKKADENDPAVTYETTFARYWNQVILYALPSAIGALIGILDVPFLYGDNGAKTMLGRVFTGVFVGGVSAFVYKSAKKRWGINLESGLQGSTRPPPPPAETPS